MVNTSIGIIKSDKNSDAMEMAFATIFSSIQEKVKGNVLDQWRVEAEQILEEIESLPISVDLLSASFLMPPNLIIKMQIVKPPPCLINEPFDGIREQLARIAGRGVIIYPIKLLYVTIDAWPGRRMIIYHDIRMSFKDFSNLMESLS